VFVDKESRILNKQSEASTIHTTTAAAHSRPDVEATQSHNNNYNNNIEMEHV